MTALVLLLPFTAAGATGDSGARPRGQAEAPIVERNTDHARDEATELPRSEADQAIVGGWPLYRTGRGQSAFNDAMAALRATDGAQPAPKAFAGCVRLQCRLRLPAIRGDGWIPAGRLWVSPTQYVLVAHSPRHRDGEPYRRRPSESMRYFVFHEFHNSTRNTDPYDTISSHSGSVFVPFYMSKEGTDARGRRFVVVVQVAPFDVVSAHAQNLGSAGPGIEVAKNVSDPLEPLQAFAGILIATVVKMAAPHLEVVNHRGTEGLPMLEAYQSRLAALQGRQAAPPVVLPFVRASAARVAAATGRLEDVIRVAGASPPIPVAARGFVPPGRADRAAAHAAVAPRPALDAQPRPAMATAILSEPRLIGPIRLAVRPAALNEPKLIGPIRRAIRPAQLSQPGTTSSR